MKKLMSLLFCGLLLLSCFNYTLAVEETTPEDADKSDQAGSLTSFGATGWTKQEVIDWYSEYRSLVRGGLGYRGSDEQWHYFIARVLDEWVFIQVSKDELELADERPYSSASSAPLAYYAVDPSRNFQKIKGKSEDENDGPTN